MKKLIMICALLITSYLKICAMDGQHPCPGYMQQMTIIENFRKGFPNERQTQAPPEVRRSKRLADKKLAKDSKKDKN